MDAADRAGAARRQAGGRESEFVRNVDAFLGTLFDVEGSTCCFPPSSLLGTQLL